jgi:23S rRNA (uracil1939-C5)-methyltransferase
MVIGNRFTATVESIASNGAGVAHMEGMTVFIEAAAPGDRVLARITGLHRTWAEGSIETIEAPSPFRVSPGCAYYGRCGGCSLQHLSYEGQLDAKIRILRDAFTRIGGFTGPGVPPEGAQSDDTLPEIDAVPSPAWAYRNRVQLHRLSHGAPGFKGRGSGDIIPVTDCPVADPGIRRLLAEAGGAEGGREAAPLPHKSRFTVYSRGEVLLIEGGAASKGRVRLFDRPINLDAGVFFQSNARMQEALINGVLAAAEQADGGQAADLYAGVGVFAMFLRDRFSRLRLVEENPAARALARENLGNPEADLFAGTVESWAAQELGKGTYDFVVADPPRTGLDRGVAELLAREGPAVLACVSCNPATLARDARILRGNYALRSLTLYDFYPQTAHIESLAVFTRDTRRRTSRRPTERLS